MDHAFLEHNLAPPALRRDIALLGLLHKRVLGLAHPAFEELFPFLPLEQRTHHDKMLESHASEITFRRALWKRSVFGKIAVYNMLPTYVVQMDSVTKFQSALTEIAMQRCRNQLVNWHLIFHSLEYARGLAWHRF